MSHEMFLSEDFAGKHGTVYKAIMMISQRARKIGEEQRKEMDAYLKSVEMMEKHDNLEDEGMIEDNPVHHEPILQFEKPTILALREMFGGKLAEKVDPKVAAANAAKAEAAGDKPEESVSYGFKLDLSEEL